MRPSFVEKIIQSDSLTIEELLSIEGRIYTFLNPVSYLDARKARSLFDSFDGIFADGSLLVKGIRLLYKKTVRRRSFDMTSLAPELFEYATKHKKTIAIVASKEEEVAQAVEIIKSLYPTISIIYWRNGYFSSEAEMESEAIHIISVNPDYLIVGMGIILQEKMLMHMKNRGYKGIAFTCGGFIHQLSRGRSYYPAWADRNNLRFVYRMYKEPHTRIRYAKAAIVFPTVFISERMKNLMWKDEVK
jgi:N-acetylglucosaminyldiphosphoundecaprenol N-acetyl-beta-D-mannosaminyltransferase